MSDVQVFRVSVIVDGQIQTCDGIEWQGKLWLVPHWLDDKSQEVSTPARIIRFDSLPHQSALGTPFADYVLTDPIPKELFDLAPVTQPIPGYEYVDMPALTQPPGDKCH